MPTIKSKISTFWSDCQDCQAHPGVPVFQRKFSSAIHLYLLKKVAIKMQDYSGKEKSRVVEIDNDCGSCLECCKWSTRGSFYQLFTCKREKHCIVFVGCCYYPVLKGWIIIPHSGQEFKTTNCSPLVCHIANLHCPEPIVCVPESDCLDCCVRMRFVHAEVLCQWPAVRTVRPRESSSDYLCSVVGHL